MIHKRQTLHPFKTSTQVLHKRARIIAQENLVAYVKPLPRTRFTDLTTSPTPAIQTPLPPTPSPSHLPKWQLEEHLPISNENRTSNQKEERGKRKEEIP